MLLSKIIGNNLKYLRYQTGLSQEKFYENYNLNPKYMACIERGEINLSVDFLQKLAKTLNVKIDYLINFDNKKIIKYKRVDSKTK